jgi:uncharacterized iron-regulated membrane protein
MSMDIGTLRAWHRWSSLASALFLLLLCLTGLPLIFSDEIDGMLRGEDPPPALPTACERPGLDCAIAQSAQRHPAEVIRWIVFDDKDSTIAAITMAPAHDAAADRNHWLRFSLNDGRLLATSETRGNNGAVMKAILRLHTNLFAGLAGELFVGVVGLLLIIATVTGVMLYGPFTKKLRFGEIRRERSRVRWLDLHNLLGIATVAWVLVVGTTGVINALSTPLFSLWRVTELARMTAHYPAVGAQTGASKPSLQTIAAGVAAAMPGTRMFSIVYPTPSPAYYLIWLRGNEHLTARLFTLVLVNASTGAIDAVAQLPWYLKLLEVSRPLHFGDYGGLPLKLLWAALDLLLLVVLGSGVYLWLARLRRERRIT